MVLDLPAGEDSILALTFSGDGRMLAAGSTTGNLKIWDAGNGSPLPQQGRSQDLAIFRLAFSPDGKRLAGVDREKVWIWGIREAQELVVLQSAPPRPYDGGFNPTVTWSPDGLRLASTNWDGSMGVWDGFPVSSTPAERMAEARSRRLGWHLGEAECALHANQPASAWFHLGCVRNEPTSDSSWHGRRARLLMRFGEWKQASDDYAAWLAGGQPDDGPAWLGAARALLLLGDAPSYERLCQRLDRDIDRDPFRQTLWSAARVFGLGPDPASASRSRKAPALASQMAEKRLPNSAFLLGLAHYRAGNWNEALTAVNRSTAQEPGRAWVNLPLLALIHHRMGRHADSRSALTRANDYLIPGPSGPPGQTTPQVLDPEFADFLILRSEARAVLAAAAANRP